MQLWRSPTYPRDGFPVLSWLRATASDVDMGPSQHPCSTSNQLPTMCSQHPGHTEASTRCRTCVSHLATGTRVRVGSRQVIAPARPGSARIVSPARRHCPPALPPACPRISVITFRTSSRPRLRGTAPSPSASAPAPAGRRTSRRRRSPRVVECGRRGPASIQGRDDRGCEYRPQHGWPVTIKPVLVNDVP